MNMFAINAPQSVLIAGARDEPPIAVTFRVDPANAARCIMDVTLPNGDVHTAVFNTRGFMTDQGVVTADEAKARVAAPLPADYIVDGVDTRSDNPYTHVAPGTVDSAYLPRPADEVVPLYGAPVVPPAPLTEDQISAREAAAKAREEAMTAAADAALKAQEERAKRAAETPEERVARLADERKARMEAAGHKPVASHDDATAKPVDGSMKAVDEPLPHPSALGYPNKLVDVPVF
jgi:hypothetical protein